MDQEEQNFLGGNLSTFDFDLPGIGETDPLAEGNEPFGTQLAGYNPEECGVSQYVDVASGMQQISTGQDIASVLSMAAGNSLNNSQPVEILDEEEGRKLLNMDEDMPPALDELDASANLLETETELEMLPVLGDTYADNNAPFPEGGFLTNSTAGISTQTPASQQDSVVGTPATVTSTVEVKAGADDDEKRVVEGENDTDEEMTTPLEGIVTEEDYGFPTNGTGRSESAVRILEVHEIEKKIVALLEIASKAIMVLAGGNEDGDSNANSVDDSKEFERLSTTYFDLLNEIQIGIRKQAQYLSNADISGTCLPFRPSSHGETKELEAWTRAAGIFRLGLNRATAFASESARN